MSGLCGIANWDGSPVSADLIASMMAVTPYRGSDGKSIHTDGITGFGYLGRQESPESVGETQPLVHSPTGVVLSCDLRLDNREELPQPEGFEGGGRTFTDAELVLASYLKWGEACVSQLLGDFAGVIWDPRSRKIHLFRDPMGMRPLYYRAGSRRLIWASELKQILAVSGVEKKLNETSVAIHLAGSQMPLGMSFYEGIEQVEPGQLVSAGTGGVTPRRYWSIDCGTRIWYRREQEYVDHFRELLQRAVSARLRSTKPVGISLSGGMDSGSVASLVGRLREKEPGRYSPGFRAYSWAFEELQQCDERAVSRMITDRYGIPTVNIPAEESWPLKDYPEHSPDEDSPFFGMYQVLIDATVAAAARDGVGVLLSGDRGDLMVGGYVPDLPGLFLSGRFGALLKEFEMVEKISGRSFPSVLRGSLARPLLALAAASLGRKSRPWYPSFGLHAPSHIRSDFLEKKSPPPELPFSMSCNSPDRAVRIRHENVFTELHFQGMVWSERTNARQGVGFADAWSDRRIAEFVLSVPQHLLHRLHDHKRIVRRALSGIMPPEALASAGKVSPRPLYVQALREKSRSTVESLSTDMRVAERGYIDGALFRSQMKKLIHGEIEMFNLWPTLSLEMWLRRYWK